jgi:putative nucleotidyltransferase with HDIG domain
MENFSHERNIFSHKEMKNFIPVIDLDAQRRKRAIISKIKSIPPLPAAAQEVLSIVAGNPRDIRRLEQVIVHDPSLSTQLLKVANCAAYYPATRIDTVQRAIVFLGFAEVRSLALSLSVSSVFKGKKSASGFDRQAFWEHSIGTAMISRVLAGELALEETDLYFTCGLLHDLGRVVMDNCFPEEWRKILEYAQAHDCSLIKAERKAGFPHNVIGAWLVRNWGIPEIYSKVIASHHLPVNHPKFNIQGGLVQLADHLSHKMGMGILKPPACKSDALANSLGIGMERLALLEEHLEKIGELAEAITTGFL